jgi:transketolase
MAKAKDSEDLKKIKEFAKKIRRHILAMAYCAGGAHIAPAFSMVEILSVLFNGVLNLNLKNLKSDNRDRFVLSKGHGCAALYAVLAEKGFFEKSQLKKFCKSGSPLGGHPDINAVSGIEASTGSLGHGLSIACGMALAGKLKKLKHKIYALLGDGECQEGTIWEAAMFAANRKLDNLVAIVDYNKFQGLGKIEEINRLEPFADKWRDFGWSVKEINGHDPIQIAKVLKAAPLKRNYPTMIIAHTVKGKGISFMENKAIWHYRLPGSEEMKVACEELDIDNIENLLS